MDAVTGVDPHFSASGINRLLSPVHTMQYLMQPVASNALHETIFQCASESQPHLANLITYPMSARILCMHEFWPT